MSETSAPPLPFHIFQALREQISQHFEECFIEDDLFSSEESQRRIERVRRRTRIRITPEQLTRAAIANSMVQLERCNQKEEDLEPFLKFQLEFQDGGEYDPNIYPISNMLIDNEDVYCSIRPRNVNILLRHAPSDSFTPRFMMTELVIKSPTVGFTSPINDGLVFISDHPIRPSDVSSYDNFDNDTTVIKDDNVFYFKFDDPSCVVRIKPTRPIGGKYVFIKLLKSKGVGENIDIKFFGVRGCYGPKSFSSGSLI